MNTYHKFVPNVFLAKCTEKHDKGESIILTTKYGKENDCIVFNLIYERDGFYYYSIVRADGFNAQEYAKNKAERLHGYSANAALKSEQYFEKSQSIIENIPLGQPILVGHHSEARHQRDLAKSWNAMGKSLEETEKAERLNERAVYWARRANTINLSMPESVEYYEFELERATARHNGLKNGTIQREHSFSLTYAKKEVKEIEGKLKLAKRLWE